jgi:diguanylate cyclase (GGDEF)-like protein
MKGRNRKRERWGNPLDWSPVDKSLLALMLVFPLYVSYEAWALFVLGREDLHVFVNVEYLQRQQPVFIGLVISTLSLMAVGWSLRGRAWANHFFPFVATMYYSLSMCYFGFMVGSMSLVAGLVLAGAPLVGFILFDRHVIYISFSMAVIAIVFFSNAAVSGLLPYGPGFHEAMPSVGPAGRFWLYCMYFFALPIIISIVLVGDFAMTRWRRREMEVRQLSLTDALTGVSNRRSITAFLEQEVARCRRGGAALSVVMVDLDHFKQINDQYGHVAGDRVLAQSARVLAESLRETDAVGRWGGEEFMLVLTGTSAEGAWSMAERCRQRLEALNIRISSGAELKVTGSFGLFCNERDPGLDADSLVRLADDALYKAKELGRNRVIPV